MYHQTRVADFLTILILEITEYLRIDLFICLKYKNLRVYSYFKERESKIGGFLKVSGLTLLLKEDLPAEISIAKRL